MSQLFIAVSETAKGVQSNRAILVLKLILVLVFILF